MKRLVNPRQDRAPGGEWRATTVFKWLCFALMAAFLSAFLWIMNDMRLEVKGLVDRLDKQLPPILANTEQATQRVNAQLPKILTNSSQAAKDINVHLPKILKNTSQAATDINTQLPQLLKKAEQAVNQLTAMAKGLEKFQFFFGSVGASTEDRNNHPE
jgi:uncharacterized phage infection (PIP) family protein YhgE